MKRKFWVLRKEKKPARAKTWPIIASKVRNLLGERPYWKVCRDAFNQLEKPSRAARDSYKNCGRKPVLTKDLIAWTLRKLRQLRVEIDVSSGDLAQALAKEKSIEVESAAIRKMLKKAGCRYMVRAKKNKV